MGVAEVVQPDHRQQVLPQHLAGLDDLAGEATGEPVRVPGVPSRFLSTRPESRARFSAGSPRAAGPHVDCVRDQEARSCLARVLTDAPLARLAPPRLSRPPTSSCWDLTRLDITVTSHRIRSGRKPLQVREIRCRSRLRCSRRSRGSEVRRGPARYGLVRTALLHLLLDGGPAVGVPHRLKRLPLGTVPAEKESSPRLLCARSGPADRACSGSMTPSPTAFRPAGRPRHSHHPGHYECEEDRGPAPAPST